MIEDVVILGGSGFMGCRLAELLVEARGGAAGTVTVVTRHIDHARHLLVLPDLDVVEADVHDDEALARVVAGRQSVVNLVGILQGDEAAFRKVHAHLPLRLVEACSRARVQRLVHVSAIGASPDAPSMYLRSKAEGEAAFADPSVPACVLRPSVVFGAHDRFLRLFARLASKSPVLPLACAEARFQPVWVDDIARAIIAGLDLAPSRPRLYECAGPQVFTLEELVLMAAHWSGRDPRIVRLPDGAARIQAWLMEHLPGEPMMSRDNIASMQVPNVASGRLPGLAELGIRATPIEAVMPQVLAGGDWRQQELDAWRQARHG